MRYLRPISLAVARFYLQRQGLGGVGRVISRNRSFTCFENLTGQRCLLSSGNHGSGHDSSTELAEGDFDHMADSLLSSLENSLDKISLQLNPEEISCAYGVLTLDFGKRGVWVLNKQSPNKQVWWSSPISGPRRFEYNREKKQWVWTRDHSISLTSLLAAELSSFSRNKIAFDV